MRIIIRKNIDYRIQKYVEFETYAASKQDIPKLIVGGIRHLGVKLILGTDKALQEKIATILDRRNHREQWHERITKEEILSPTVRNRKFVYACGCYFDIDKQSFSICQDCQPYTEKETRKIRGIENEIINLHVFMQHITLSCSNETLVFEFETTQTSMVHNQRRKESLMTTQVSHGHKGTWYEEIYTVSSELFYCGCIIGTINATNIQHFFIFNNCKQQAHISLYHHVIIPLNHTQLRKFIRENNEYVKKAIHNHIHFLLNEKRTRVLMENIADKSQLTPILASMV